MMTGLGARAERWWARHADGWGRIDLAALRVGGRDALADLVFVQPDDGNPDDHTLARLRLPGPVPPRGTVELEIDFISTLPPYSGSAWQAATGLAPGMARLWCLALVAQGLWGAAIAGPLWAFVRTTAESPSAWVWYAGGGAAASLWLLGGLWLVAVHDQARLRLGLADCGALAAWGWATRFVLRGGRGAFALARLLQATALGIWALYQSLSLALPLRELLGLTGSLLLGQAFLLARTWLRVWMLAAQRQLQA